MPKDATGKNRKYKNHKEKEFSELTAEQIQRAEKIARGEKVEQEEEQPEQKQEQNEPKGRWNSKPQKLKQTRNYDIPPPQDSD